MLCQAGAALKDQSAEGLLPACSQVIPEELLRILRATPLKHIWRPGAPGAAAAMLAGTAAPGAADLLARLLAR